MPFEQLVAIGLQQCLITQITNMNQAAVRRDCVQSDGLSEEAMVPEMMDRPRLVIYL
jgi:hypothetical protein